MSSNATTPKDDSEVPFERIVSMHSRDQLQPPYPQTLKLAQTHGDGGNVPKTNASPQPHTGSTGRSPSEGPADKPAAYLSVGRAWGKIAQGNGRSSAAGYSPISNWEHGVVLGEPWNGVGEVAAGANGGERSVRWSQPENHRSEKDSDCATKGSSKDPNSGS